MKAIAFMMLFVLVSVQVTLAHEEVARDTVINYPEPYVIGFEEDYYYQDYFGNFEQLPSNLEGVPLPLYLETGDIVYSPHGSSLIAYKENCYCNEKVIFGDYWEFLYFDFNVPLLHSDYPRPLKDLEGYKPYWAAGKVDDFTLQVLNSGYDETWKQFIIWKHYGVDESSLRIVWLKAYHRSIEEYEKMYDALEYHHSQADIAYDLETALAKGMIGVDYHADGYSSIDISLHSTDQTGTSPTAVFIPLGQRFENAGGKNQDLATAEPVMVLVPHQDDKVVTISSYCINQHRGVPSYSDDFVVAGKAPDNVVEEIFIQYGTGNAQAAQGAIWAETDGNGYADQWTEELNWAYNVPDGRQPTIQEDVPASNAHTSFWELFWRILFGAWF